MPSPSVTPVSRSEIVSWIEGWTRRICSLLDEMRLDRLDRFHCLGRKVDSHWRGVHVYANADSSSRPQFWCNGSSLFFDGRSLNIYGIFAPAFQGSDDPEWNPENEFVLHGIMSKGLDIFDKRWIRVEVKCGMVGAWQIATEIRIDTITPDQLVTSTEQALGIARALQIRLDTIITSRHAVLGKAVEINMRLKEGMNIFRTRMNDVYATEQEFRLPAEMYTPDDRVMPVGRDGDGQLVVQAWLNLGESICPHCVRIHIGPVCPHCINQPNT